MNTPEANATVKTLPSIADVLNGHFTGKTTMADQQHLKEQHGKYIPVSL